VSATVDGRGAQVRVRNFTFIVEFGDNPQMIIAQSGSRVYEFLPGSFCHKTELQLPTLAMQ